MSTQLCNLRLIIKHKDIPWPPQWWRYVIYLNGIFLSPKNILTAQFEELESQSEGLLDIKGNALHHTLWYNYVICKQKLDNQHKEHMAKQANAEIEFVWEQQLKKLDIQLKEKEELTYTHQIELFCLQIKYQQSMH